MKFLFVAIGDFLKILLEAFVAKTAWAWFAVPLFDLPMISMPAAYGLTCLLHFLCPTNYDWKQIKNRSTEESIEQWTFTMFQTLCIFAVAFVCKLLM